MHPKELSIQDFTYHLPEDRIAAYPLPERDGSKLLVYKNGNISEDTYRNLATYLPAGSLLVFNNTKVIQARLLFQKPTGGTIEIFCLEPYESVNEYSTIMAQQTSARWKCMIGGASKWKSGPLEKNIMIDVKKQVTLRARLVERLTDAYVVELSWTPSEFSFAEIIEHAGATPLPPYIKRAPSGDDKQRYQTIYATYDGSVAAPTAGLHFTPDIFVELNAAQIKSTYVALHVGAGTFKPVKSSYMHAHEMHAEWIDVSAETIYDLLANFEKGIIAVGTTSVRTLESIYWMGVRTLLNPAILPGEIALRQWDVYEEPLAKAGIGVTTALNALLSWMKANNLDRLITQTQILIAPGYEFKIPSAIITNFHQPQSTLLLLVAAAIGKDWKAVYEYAMKNDFRFLSYGDGSLLYINRANVVE